MNPSQMILRVHGPVPDSPHSDAEAALGLLRELRGYPGLRVARAGPDARGDPAEQSGDPGGPGGELDRPNGDPGEPAGRIAAAEPTFGLVGRKGPTSSLAELVVTGLFSATTVAGLAQVAVAFIQRGAARRISIRDGDRTLTITGPSEDTERMAAEWLGQQSAPMDTDSGAG